MRTSKTVYLVLVAGTTVCCAATKQLGQKEMRRLAEYESWNRRTAIKDEKDCCITLANYDRIEITEVQMYHSYKGFIQSMGLEEIPNE